MSNCRNQVDEIVDSVREWLQTLLDGNEIPQKEATLLHKKRKLITPNTWKTYKLTKGSKFALSRRKQATDLTREMILKCKHRLIGRTCEFILLGEHGRNKSSKLTTSMLWDCHHKADVCIPY